MFMRTTVFEIAGGPPDPHPLVKGVGTKSIGKGRVKLIKSYCEARLSPSAFCSYPCLASSVAYINTSLFYLIDVILNGRYL